MFFFLEWDYYFFQEKMGQKCNFSVLFLQTSKLFIHCLLFFLILYPNTIILVYYLYKPIFLGVILYSMPTLNGIYTCYSRQFIKWYLMHTSNTQIFVENKLTPDITHLIFIRLLLMLITCKDGILLHRILVGKRVRAS